MSRDVEERIGIVARKQHGVLTVAQLLEAGLSRGAVQRRVGAGVFQRLHHGVYLVSPLELPFARKMAAVLACGPSALLSRDSAAATWGMIPVRANAIDISVTVIGRTAAPQPGIRVASTMRMDASERTCFEGIPITTPARSLLDYAVVASDRGLEQAIAAGERKGLVGAGELAALVRRSKGRRGVRALRRVLAAHADPAFIRSEAEERFLSLIREAKLPDPRVNVNVHGYEVDFYWPEQRLIVEVDGYEFHSSRSSFEKDRGRATHFAARGIQVVPITWRQIEHHALATVTQITRALMWKE